MRTLLTFLAIYLLLIFRHGYSFGSGDQSEMLPYAKYLIDNGLYPKDFYIQNIAAHVPNERFVFSWLLSRLGNGIEIAAFVGHFVATMLLLWGLHRLSKKWLNTEGWIWVATMLPVLFFYGNNLGGNELYYNSLIPSYLAQVAGLWMFIFIMEGKFEWSYIFLAIAVFLHPLIGMQLWILMILMKIGLGIWQFDRNAGRNFFILQGVCGVVFGAYLWQILQSYKGATPIPTTIFFDIMKFRAAHHHFPTYFGGWNWLLLPAIILIGWVNAMAQLRLLFTYIILGCLVYVIGAFVFRWQLPLSTQWFATTVWLKTFSLIILMGEFEDLCADLEWEHYFKDNPLVSNVLITAALACAVFIYPPLSPFKQKSYDLPFWKNTSPEVRISEIARQNTPADALFLVPMEVSAFRFWSERNTYVDFKAINHQHTAFVEWYRRMMQVYQLSVSNRIEKADLNFVGNTNFRNRSTEDFRKLAIQTGVTHVLMLKEPVLGFPKIGENEKYVVYKIDGL